MEFFVNKNILIVSVKFFNYENLIKEELIKAGANVDLFDERPSNSVLSKAIIRVRKSLYRHIIKKHFKKIINQIRPKTYDYFLLIKGEAVPSFFLEFLRKNNPGIQMIYYTYDSFKNNLNGLDNLSFFDKKFTFDRKDSEKYNLSFRPLFYAPEYSIVAKEENSNKYDLSFIGTAHSDRYRISQNLGEECFRLGLKMFNFYFSPSKLLFNFKKITDKYFLNFDRKKISFKSLSHSEIINIYRESGAILDINHPGQDGLTMRTFETLGAKKKLVTTNENIKDYPFYNESNILIIDRNNPYIPLIFFKKKFEDIDPDVYYCMSLKGWLEELFINQSKIWEKV
jgi:hypothetical protein